MNAHAAPGASLYDKLNNVHASLRKQKEDAYRTKQLAEERLRLARQDRAAAERKGAELRDRLRQLKEKAVEMKSVNARTEEGNRQLEREFNYQHSELQGKKEKLSRLQEKRDAESRERRTSLGSAREMLRRLREDSSRQNAAPTHASDLTPEERRRRLERATEVDGGEGLCRDLPELMKMRRVGKEEEASDVEARNASMRRIIAGYQNALGGMMELNHGGGGGAEGSIAS